MSPGRKRSGWASLVSIILVASVSGTWLIDRALGQWQAEEKARLAGARSGPTPDPLLCLLEATHFPLPEGKPAPEVDVPALEGSGRFDLADRCRSQPVVLAFGSFTCRGFHKQLADLERCYQHYKDRVTFAFIGIREAGADVPGYEFLLEPPGGETGAENVEERRQKVRRAMQMADLPLPAYLAEPGSTVTRAYSAWPARLVLVGTDGCIARDFGSIHARQWDWEKVSAALEAELARHHSAKHSQ